MTDYKKTIEDLRHADNLTADHKLLGVCARAADAIESLQKELDAANHQLKMYSMCPFDDEEEEA